MAFLQTWITNHIGDMIPGRQDVRRVYHQGGRRAGRRVYHQGVHRAGRRVYHQGVHRAGHRVLVLVVKQNN